MKRTGDSITSSPAESDSSHTRELLGALEHIAFASRRGGPLTQLCAAGARYGLEKLERELSQELLRSLSAKAKATLSRHLQRTLEQVTAPSLELEWNSFSLAMESLGFRQVSAANSAEQIFLGDRPTHRLRSLFRKFPVLPRLWLLAIRQWHKHIAELLSRIAKDRAAISRLFFDDRPITRIRNMRPGLSDPHKSGRSVTLIEFDSGLLVYKPRSGRSEAEWFELLRWINEHGFVPKLRAARVLERGSYSWMEYIEAKSCGDEAGIERFYERLGGTIAIAYLLKAVDCHRENVIAAGEFPVVVDVDALWHVSPLTKTQSPTTLLYRTGFFPNSRRRSLQSRSSVLGFARTGKHLARIHDRPVEASDYAKEIVRGFCRAWDCLLGTSSRRSIFLRKLHQIRRLPRRWIYLATERYAAILRASVSPSALKAEEARKALITALCRRSSATPGLIGAEVRALMQLDLPYFVRQTNELMPADKSAMPSELVEAIQNTLLSATNRSLERH